MKEEPGLSMSVPGVVKEEPGLVIYNRSRGGGGCLV